VSSAPIAHADARREDLAPSPIHPPHVLAGEPVARSLMLTRSADGLVSTHLWDCTAGRFVWNFGVDEIVHILDGEVHMTDSAGTTVVVRAGDVGHFPTGATTEWFVPEYVRKLAFHRAAPPRGRVERVARRIARRLVRR
jgi:uncharacterized cupin superfamily protein